MKKYKLLKDLPNLKKGAIFEHRDYDHKFPDRGNRGCGVLILSWINGNTQDSWAGESYIFQGQLADNLEWFEEINETENIIKLIKNKNDGEIFNLKNSDIEKIREILNTLNN